MNDRILMTGTSGWVGSGVVQSLMRSGIQVIPAGRTAPSGGGEFYMIDLSDASFKGLYPVPEVLIHNAAAVLPGNTEEERALLWRVNVEATRNLFRSAAEGGTRTIIYTSSYSVLQRPLPGRITEEAPVGPMGAYGLSKLEGELFLSETGEEFGIATYSLRISSPVSTGASVPPSGVLGRWLELAKDGKPLTVFGSGMRTQDFIHTSDIAQAIRLLLTGKAPSGVYNLASGGSTTMKALADLIAGCFEVGVEFSGTDPLEEERWNIDYTKAERTFGYHPEFTSQQSVLDLLQKIRP